MISYILTFLKINPFRIYYSTRNRVYFENENLVDNIFAYTLNRIIFQSILLLFSLKNLSTYKIFCNAVDDGLNKKMGETITYAYNHIELLTLGYTTQNINLGIW